MKGPLNTQQTPPSLPTLSPLPQKNGHVRWKILTALGSCILAVYIVKFSLNPNVNSPPVNTSPHAKDTPEQRAVNAKKSWDQYVSTPKGKADLANRKKADAEAGLGRKEPGSQWTYSNEEDKMGRKRSYAYLSSTNTLDFGFPYQGSQYGRIMIRKSATGTDALVEIEKGQFVCGIEECTLQVRFASGPVHRYSGREPADHSTTVLFIGNAPGFVAQLQRAKIVRIEATFYQEGLQVIEFNVDGYKEHLEAQKQHQK
jgi:hypothetical protein